MSEKSEALKKEREQLNIELREKKARNAMTRVYVAAAKTLEGLYLPEFIEKDGQKVPNPDYNDDAKKTWSESSMKTRAALVLAKEQAKDLDADIPSVFGIIIMRARARDPGAWEAQARKVDEEQRQIAGKPVIDVVVDEKAAVG